MKDRSKGITRKSVDLTESQLAAVEEMIAIMQSRLSGVRISTRQFFHAVLKEKAESMGLEWPDDYPEPGGWRGDKTHEADES